MSYGNIRRIIIQTLGGINRELIMNNRKKCELSKEAYERYKVDLDNCIHNGSYIDDDGVQRKPKIIIAAMHDV